MTPDTFSNIWKGSFISMVRPTIHTNPSKAELLENALQKFKNAGLTFPGSVWTEVIF